MASDIMTLPVLTSESTLALYLDKISRFPYLTQEEEMSLAQRFVEEQDITAAHQLVTSHLRLVVKIAHGFRGYGLPLLELISEGNIGLMQAVKKFDPSKGFRLATYAMWWIKASIQEYVLHSWSLVKIGTTAAQKKLFFSLRKIKRRLNKIDNTQLTDSEINIIASELDVSRRDVIEMDSRLSQSDQSLNAPLKEEENSPEMIDYLVQDASHELQMVAKNEMQFKRRLFSQALTKLNDREKAIVFKRHLQEIPATLEELSQEYKISRERVRQIETKALEKLQTFVVQAQAVSC